MLRFLPNHRKPKSPPPPPTIHDLDLSNVLPSSDRFRTSLILPNLSARFSMLRYDIDTSSYSSASSTSASSSSSSSTTTSALISTTPLPPSPNSKFITTFSNSSSDPSPLTTSSPNSNHLPQNSPSTSPSHPAPAPAPLSDASLLSRSRPCRGNVLFGGRQKIFKISSTSNTMSSGRTLYHDDVSSLAFRRLNLPRFTSNSSPIDDRFSYPPSTSTNSLVHRHNCPKSFHESSRDHSPSSSRTPSPSPLSSSTSCATHLPTTTPSLPSDATLTNQKPSLPSSTRKLRLYDLDYLPLRSNAISRLQLPLPTANVSTNVTTISSSPCATSEVTPPQQQQPQHPPSSPSHSSLNPTISSTSSLPTSIIAAPASSSSSLLVMASQTSTSTTSATTITTTTTSSTTATLPTVSMPDSSLRSLSAASQRLFLAPTTYTLPISPPATPIVADSDNPHNVILSSIHPADRGKATATGTFSRPQQFDEAQYRLRQNLPQVKFRYDQPPPPPPPLPPSAPPSSRTSTLASTLGSRDSQSSLAYSPPLVNGSATASTVSSSSNSPNNNANSVPSSTEPFAASHPLSSSPSLSLAGKPSFSDLSTLANISPDHKPAFISLELAKRLNSLVLNKLPPVKQHPAFSSSVRASSKFKVRYATKPCPETDPTILSSACLVKTKSSVISDQHVESPPPPSPLHTTTSCTISTQNPSATSATLDSSVTATRPGALSGLVRQHLRVVSTTVSPTNPAPRSTSHTIRSDFVHDSCETLTPSCDESSNSTQRSTLPTRSTAVSLARSAATLSVAEAESSPALNDARSSLPSYGSSLLPNGWDCDDTQNDSDRTSTQSQQRRGMLRVAAGSIVGSIGCRAISDTLSRSPLPPSFDPSSTSRPSRDKFTLSQVTSSDGYVEGPDVNGDGDPGAEADVDVDGDGEDAESSRTSRATLFSTSSECLTHAKFRSLRDASPDTLLERAQFSQELERRRQLIRQSLRDKSVVNTLDKPVKSAATAAPNVINGITGSAVDHTHEKSDSRSAKVLASLRAISNGNDVKEVRSTVGSVASVAGKSLRAKQSVGGDSKDTLNTTTTATHATGGLRLIGRRRERGTTTTSGGVGAGASTGTSSLGGSSVSNTTLSSAGIRSTAMTTSTVSTGTSSFTTDASITRASANSDTPWSTNESAPSSRNTSIRDAPRSSRRSSSEMSRSRSSDIGIGFSLTQSNDNHSVSRKSTIEVDAGSIKLENSVSHANTLTDISEGGNLEREKCLPDVPEVIAANELMPTTTAPVQTNIRHRSNLPPLPPLPMSLKHTGNPVPVRNSSVNRSPLARAYIARDMRVMGHRARKRPVLKSQISHPLMLISASNALVDGVDVGVARLNRLAILEEREEGARSSMGVGGEGRGACDSIFGSGSGFEGVGLSGDDTGGGIGSTLSRKTAATVFSTTSSSSSSSTSSSSIVTAGISGSKTGNLGGSNIPKGRLRFGLRNAGTAIAAATNMSIGHSRSGESSGSSSGDNGHGTAGVANDWIRAPRRLRKATSEGWSLHILSRKGGSGNVTTATTGATTMVTMTMTRESDKSLEDISTTEGTAAAVV